MTRKHYEMLANWFAEYHVNENTEGVSILLDDMLNTLTQTLAQTNERFDAKRFIERASANR